jgi:hypothetical protein
MARSGCARPQASSRAVGRQLAERRADCCRPTVQLGAHDREAGIRRRRTMSLVVSARKMSPPNRNSSSATMKKCFGSSAIARAADARPEGLAADAVPAARAGLCWLLDRPRQRGHLFDGGPVVTCPARRAGKECPGRGGRMPLLCPPRVRAARCLPRLRGLPAGLVRGRAPYRARNKMFLRLRRSSADASPSSAPSHGLPPAQHHSTTHPA